jgi:hypothetical protein
MRITRRIKQDEKRDQVNYARRNARRFEVFIISQASEDYSYTERLRFIKRLILDDQDVIDLVMIRDSLSFAYNVSILSYLSSDQLLDILIALRDRKLISYAEINLTREEIK